MAPTRSRLWSQCFGGTLFRIAVVAGFACLPAGGPAFAAAPDSPEVKQAIDKAVALLKTRGPGEPDTSGDGLVAYAILKGGVPATDPVVQTLLVRIEAKFSGGSYTAVRHGWYEAACDIMAFEAADPVKYRQAIGAIAAQIAAAQNDAGGWNYPHERNSARGGDLSVTQYALLGLWAAQRAGVDVRADVWDRAANWLSTSSIAGNGPQNPNGGFQYRPGESYPTTHSMTVAGVGCLYICRQFLYPAAPGGLVRAEPPKPEPPPQETPVQKQKRLGIRWGVLEPLPVETEEKPDEPAPAAQPAPRVRTPLVRIDQSIRAGLNWLDRDFVVGNAPGWPNYYLYGLERMAALANLQQIANRDWYDEGSNHLLRNQRRDGGWDTTQGLESGIISASFGVLFLSQSTRKLLGPRAVLDPVAGGVLKGDRLPEDLSMAEVDEDGKIKQVKLSGPFEVLLAELAKGDAGIAPAQAAIVDTVRDMDREELVGRKDKLVELAGHSDPGVRLTAIWALGRTDDLELAPLLLKGLRDQNVDVNVEAYNALCFLSRKPQGVGLPASPYDGLAADANDVERRQALERWREIALDRWTRWHYSVRPYAERDDLPEKVGSP
ncbi:MAG: HEAT repeat domain-containing protein [Planctomycetaceae bacterium]